MRCPAAGRASTVLGTENRESRIKNLSPGSAPGPAHALPGGCVRVARVRNACVLSSAGLPRWGTALVCERREGAGAVHGKPRRRCARAGLACYGTHNGYATGWVARSAGRRDAGRCASVRGCATGIIAWEGGCGEDIKTVAEGSGGRRAPVVSVSASTGVCVGGSAGVWWWYVCVYACPLCVLLTG